MARGILIILLGITTAFANEAHNMEELQKTLLPLLNEHAAAPQQNEVVNQQTSQTIVQQNPNIVNIPNQQELGGKIELQVKPMSYKLYETSNYVSNIGGCSTNSYYSVNTVLPIFGMLLELLHHSTDLDRAFSVCQLIKNYLEGAPPSQEKMSFLEQLRVTEERLVLIKASIGVDNTENVNVNPSYQHTTIVFQIEPPGTNQQNCRETLSRLIQTAVNVYSETAKYPQCQPNGVIDENLFYPNNYAKPQKPYQFVVIYKNPPVSYYNPDNGGRINILPNLNVNYPKYEHLYPNYDIHKTFFNIPNDGNIIQYLPNQISPNDGNVIQHLPNQILPNQTPNDGNIIQYLPNQILPNDGNIIQYLPNQILPNQISPSQILPIQISPTQIPNNHYQPSAEKVKSRLDILAWIRQYNSLHPEAPKNENNVLEILNNITEKPYNNNIYSPPSIMPNNVVNPDILQNYPSQTFVYGPENPGSYLTHIYPPGVHNRIPGVVSDQLQNNPGLILQNPELLLPNNGYVPGTSVKPEQPVNGVSSLCVNQLCDINGQQNVPNTFIVDNRKPKSENAQNNPELTLEILLSLLGRPEGAKPQLGFNPQLESQLWQQLHPNNGNPVNQFVPNNPNENLNYDVYGPDGEPAKQSLIDYLNQLKTASQPGVPPGYANNDYDALLKKMQRWLAMSNGNKLPQLQNNGNVIELTYVLKRPKPLIYRPIYYVKYRLPYQSFVHNFQNLIMKKPGLRSDPENLYQELVSVSNISDVSPNLKGIGKEEILKLVFGNGTLVDARVVGISDNVLNEQLEATRKMNAEVDPKVLEELSSNLGFNKSKNSNLSDAIGWPQPLIKTTRPVKALTVDGLPTPPNLPAQLINTKPTRPVHEGTSKYPYQVPGPSSVSAVPSQPLNVPPPIGYTKPLTRDWVSGVSNDRSINN